MRDDKLLYPLPEGFEMGELRLNDPFDYLPHESVRAAAEIVVERLERLSEGDDALREELSRGKMLGVLVVRAVSGEVGFLAAFSGSMAGRTQVEGFVPPIYDLDGEGGYFREVEGEIGALSGQIEAAESDERYRAEQQRYSDMCGEVERRIAHAKAEYAVSKRHRAEERKSAVGDAERLKQIERESQHQKGELRRLESSLRAELEQQRERVESVRESIREMKSRRSAMSNTLQRRMFESYNVLNGRGENQSLLSIFKERYDRLPPAGAGECAAPKLLHYAFANGYKPLAVGEFWRGRSPRGEVRREGEFYGACHGKCLPILTYMLQGVDVAPVEEALARDGAAMGELEIIFEDSEIVVFNKPAGMLSVRGRIDAPSVEEFVSGYCAGAVMLHRLDQDTSGVLVVAKSAEVHSALQRQFIERTIKKRYLAVVEGDVAAESGEISLALRAEPLDRPRQVVDRDRGRSATTYFEVLERAEDRSTTRLALYPHTGRTHQLRLHCAHQEGLATPIMGDRLYGRGVVSSPRLALHAESITLHHPRTGERVTFRCDATF